MTSAYAQAYGEALAEDFTLYVRGFISEQEWLHREALVIVALTRASSHTLPMTAVSA